LERPGEVVSREDLIGRLWADGTHVDYDRGLNAAVTRLRQALSDSAENPRYVETVARRGYRFIALLHTPVEPAHVQQPPVEESSPPLVQETATRPDSPPRRRRSVPSVLVAAGVALTLLAGSWLWTQRKTADPGLEPVPLTSYPGVETHPSFSPDGTQVAFSWNGEAQDNFDIYVQAVGSGAPLRITTDAAPDVFPVWSPDGRFIAFFRERQGIFLVPPTRGAEIQIVDATGVPGQISWSADSRHIAYTRQLGEAEPGGIYVVDFEVGNVSRRLITPEPPRHLRSPVFSPDGRWLAFASCHGGNACDVSAVAVDAQLRPSESVRTLASKANSLFGLAWTPNADNILFTESTGGGSLGQRLWTLPLRPGAGPQLVGFAATQSSSPAISRAGSRMAYSSALVGDTNLWQITNGVFSRTVASSTQMDMSPEFSPDGKRIVFASARSGHAEIWVANADGSNPVKLTSSKYSGSPRWSPDGQRIIYDTQAPDGNWDVHVIDAAGGRSSAVVYHTADDISPSFSRDGRSIYFSSNRRGRHELYRVPAAGGEPQRLADGGGTALESVDGKFVYHVAPGVGCHALFVLPVTGGAERKVADAVCNRAFAVTRHGIYYVSGRVVGGLQAPGVPVRSDASPVVELLEPGGKRRVVAGTGNDTFQFAQGLTVSLDGSTILVSGSSPVGADLYLVEGFH
jgi:Tol biopolymer transport system component/DNA-binding winged helix-turn-helix (wHTH) protein